MKYKILKLIGLSSGSTYNYDKDTGKYVDNTGITQIYDSIFNKNYQLEPYQIEYNNMILNIGSIVSYIDKRYPFPFSSKIKKFRVNKTENIIEILVNDNITTSVIQFEDILCIDQNIVENTENNTISNDYTLEDIEKVLMNILDDDVLTQTLNDFRKYKNKLLIL